METQRIGGQTLIKMLGKNVIVLAKAIGLAPRNGSVLAFFFFFLFSS